MSITAYPVGTRLLFVNGIVSNDAYPDGDVIVVGEPEWKLAIADDPRVWVQYTGGGLTFGAWPNELSFPPVTATPADVARHQREAAILERIHDVAATGLVLATL